MGCSEDMCVTGSDSMGLLLNYKLDQLIHALNTTTCLCHTPLPYTTEGYCHTQHNSALELQ